MPGSQSAPDVSELASDIGRSHIWRGLAYADIRSRYRRSKLGPLWLVVGIGVYVLAISLIFSQLFGRSIADYLPYFATGVIVWTFITNTLNEATSTLVASGHLIKAFNMPIAVHVMRMVQRNFLVFGHNIIIVAILWLVFRWPLHWSMLSALAGVILLYVFLAASSIVISIVGVRHRDLTPMMTVITQFLFLASPIMWYPEAIRWGAMVVTLNPLAHFIAIVRDPLLGRPLSLSTWLIAVVLTLAAVFLAAGVYGRYRHRVAYWV